jgi:LPS sulfotransferase NodH
VQLDDTSIARDTLKNLLLAGRRSDTDFIWTRISERCAHEREITKLYGEAMRPSADHPPSDRLILILVFTNRSGSNFFCDCLSATGKFENAGEAFNAEIVANRTARHQISSFPEYCLRRVAEIGEPAKHVVVKAGIRQLVMLWKYGIIGPGGLFGNTKYIQIERRDVLAQAISYSIADQTRQFTSRQRKQVLEPNFDARDIQAKLAGIIQQNAMCKEFFSTVDLPVFPIVYEALVAHLPKVFVRLAKFLEIGPIEVNEDEIVLEKQRTKINNQFKERYRELMTRDFFGWAEASAARG